MEQPIVSKPVARGQSRYAREAVELLGNLIRVARAEQKLTIAEVAERAGVSRGLVHRVENGDQGCSIGAAFEIAAIVGLRLFDSEPTALTRNLTAARDWLTLLPRSVRANTRSVNDEF